MCREGMQGHTGMQGHVVYSPEGCQAGLQEGMQGHSWLDLTGLCRAPQGYCAGMQGHKGMRCQRGVRLGGQMAFLGLV